ncbi:biliverdin-producing heme oxygenase [Halopseudomonas nanhaiensis]|uniref:biliverdin-producing heme oxygenase n=1 Tax=Halopseudomonas nanhaiensis TaxID=2830842 RepID=UPI001CBFD2B8|nr:biliverdin-producing heme oxygenase [Halopseudomonas nanhaiensis]UAW99368.1 biliverdin-producing heme oxygenase [Halopseudomonas nanhaiensis]
MTRSSEPSPALAALRDATRALHADLDQHSPLAQEHLHSASYLDHAARVLGWMRPLEQAVWLTPLSCALEPQLMIEKRLGKSSWLEQDLAEGGFSPMRLAEIPRCPYIPAPTSQAELLGMAYVTEGATLGGAFLSKRWAGRLDGLSLRWLKGYGAETGALWKSFLDVLAVHVVTSSDIAAAQHAAQSTFLSFRCWVIDEAPELPR